MNNNWPTRAQDMFIAEQIMEEYANHQHSTTLGLFELFVDETEKRMDFRLSNWVLALAHHFKSIYGEIQGDFVTRKVISSCFTDGHVLH